MNNPSILLVEDDQSLGATLQERLKKTGYSVTWAATVNDAESCLEAKTYDLAVVDIGLPDGNGYSFAEHMRSVSTTPFLFLSAFDSAANRLKGFELGADDFIPKPFHLRELLLRVKNALTKHQSNGNMLIADIEINFSEMSVRYPDGTTSFPIHSDLTILKTLIDKSPQILSREDLWKAVHGKEEMRKSFRSIDNAIVRLRQLLGEEAATHIRSVRGKGYQWIVSS